jgi:hypothetical protein
MSIEEKDSAPLPRIEIPGDVLIPDAQFCADVLAGAARRTAARLDRQGLPFVMVRGHKYRPLNEGRKWLADRIRRRQPRRRAHGTAE